jgi:hypothetical protein
MGKEIGITPLGNDTTLFPDSSVRNSQNSKNKKQITLIFPDSSGWKWMVLFHKNI